MPALRVPLCCLSVGVRQVMIFLIFCVFWWCTRSVVTKFGVCCDGDEAGKGAKGYRIAAHTAA